MRHVAEEARLARVRAPRPRPTGSILPAGGRHRSRPWPAAPARARPGGPGRRRCATRRACRRRRRGERRQPRRRGAPRSRASSASKVRCTSGRGSACSNPPGAQGDGARRRIEVAAVGRAGQTFEAEAAGARRERRLQVAEEFVALRGDARGIGVQAQAGGELDGAAVARVGPEVVPVRIRGLVGIAFVADRGRHQAEVGGALARPVRFGALARAQRFHVPDRRRARAAIARGPSLRRRCSATARRRRRRTRRRCRSPAPGRRRARWRSTAPCRS